MTYMMYLKGRYQSLRDKVLSYIGLAMKSGNISSGEFSTEKVVKNMTAFLVIIAKDASENTKKKFQNMCSFYEVPVYEYGTREELGHAIGKDYRAMLAIRDEGLAKAVIKNINREVTDIWQK
ncbi:MAG: 50S ribosomal protein L7ae [Lachnospiraceae bacterium]|nr:50S ribosomal protein L7ae [Lachnospiraceae bacterium]